MKPLHQIAEFQSSPELTEQLYHYGTVKHYRGGEPILSENAYIRAIPIVMHGTVRVMRTEKDGREILLYYIQAGESCIMSFLGGLHNDTSKVRAEAVADSEVLFLPMDKVSLFISQYPQWLSYIFKLYHKRFEELLDRVNAVAFHTVDERLWALLRQKAQLNGSLVVHITHEQLANELGTARVVASRLLKQLEKEGRLQLGRNKIVLTASQ